MHVIMLKIDFSVMIFCLLTLPDSQSSQMLIDEHHGIATYGTNQPKVKQHMWGTRTRHMYNAHNMQGKNEDTQGLFACVY